MQALSAKTNATLHKRGVMPARLYNLSVENG